MTGIKGKSIIIGVIFWLGAVWVMPSYAAQVYCINNSKRDVYLTFELFNGLRKYTGPHEIMVKANSKRKWDDIWSSFASHNMSYSAQPDGTIYRNFIPTGKYDLTWQYFVTVTCDDYDDKLGIWCEGKWSKH